MEEIMKTTIALLLALSLTGCAQMFTAKTKASYVSPDGTQILYESDKEQQGFAFEYDPVTKKITVKTDKSGTLESVVAATLQMQLETLKMIQALTAGARAGATSAS
jgi:hypothetical protein